MLSRVVLSKRNALLFTERRPSAAVMVQGLHLADSSIYKDVALNETSSYRLGKAKFTRYVKSARGGSKMLGNRITPMVRDDLSDEARKILDLWSGGRKEPKNIFKVYFKNELLNNHWAVMAGHLFFKNSLTSRQREIMVLRVTWRCRSDYEFINHLEIARDRDLMTEDEMLDLTRDRQNLNWSREEAALIAATNEIAETTEISDETWAILSETLNDAQLMDAIVTVGGYTLNSMACNSLGIDIDPEHSRDEGLTPSELGPTDIEQKYTATGEAARLGPLSLDEVAEDKRPKIDKALEHTNARHRVMTLARHMQLFEDWAPITNYVLRKAHLSSIETYLIVLRAFWKHNCVYGFTHAAQEAAALGMPDDLIDNIPQGSGAAVYSVKQKLLLSAVDQLVDDIFIQDDLWAKLRNHFSELDMMDVVFTCGNTYITAVFLKTLRIQLETDVTPHQAFA